MRIADKLQETELRIIKALYDKWKAQNTDHVTFQAQNVSLNQMLGDIGMSINQAHTHLESLQGFDFIEFDKNNIKLLPSGIKYARGQFDHIV